MSSDDNDGRDNSGTDRWKRAAQVAAWLLAVSVPAIPDWIQLFQ